MSDTNDLRPAEVQLDHLRQLSRDRKTLPAGATARQVRDRYGWSTQTDPMPAASMMSRHPELFVLRDRVIHLRVKCRSCRVEALMALQSDPEPGEEVILNKLPRFAVWIAQRWECEACSAKSEAAEEHKSLGKQVADRVRVSGLPRAIAEEVSWKTMIEKGADDEETKKRIRAIETARVWASKPQPAHALLIWGPAGAGKTRLAATAALERMRHSPISWVSIAVLMTRLEGAFNDQERHEALRVVTGKGPVVLDDIDKIPNTSSRTINHLFTAMDRREQAGEMAVIFTCNAKPSELGAKLGDVLMSRITGMCHSNAGVLHFPGPDRRLELGENAHSEQALAAAERWGLDTD